MAWADGELTPTSRRHQAAMQAGLREAMSDLAAGVCVVTTWVEGRPWGTAVSSCCSLSMQPVLLLVCLENATTATRAILEQQCFGVNVLGADQDHIARRVSARAKPKFIDDLVSEDGEMGTPRIGGVVSFLHCELYNAVAVGDHTIAIGEVGDVGLGSLSDPLIYFRRRYCRIAEESL
jgi:flavin reductase ActVB